MRRFFFDSFCFASLLATLATLGLWVHSNSRFDLFHSWWIDGGNGSELNHLYIQSDHGQVEVYSTHATRIDARNAPVAWPTHLRPNYRSVEIRQHPPDQAARSYANSFSPVPEEVHGFNWARERLVTPAEGSTRETYRGKSGYGGSYGGSFSGPFGSSYPGFDPGERVKEDHVFFAFPYWSLVSLLALPLGWRVVTTRGRAKRKAAGAAQAAPPPGVVRA